jgi:hypothetical protein
MSIQDQYLLLLEKVAGRVSQEDIQASYNFCMQKQASPQDLLLAAAAGALPAYLLGSQLGKDDERKKHKNYALAGAAAGFLGPKLLGAITNPASISDSVSGIDADYIKSLQLENID